MATKSRHYLTDEARAERRRADRERLQKSAEQLLNSDGWQRRVRVRSQAGLARLSLSNQLLVALARPDATFVAGFKAWLKLGYCGRRGRPIAIIAPRPVRDKLSGEETGETCLQFKTVFVFDRQQVAPLPSGSPTPLEPLCEAADRRLTRALFGAIAAGRGVARVLCLVRVDPGELSGWCDAKATRIVVGTDAPGNA